MSSVRTASMAPTWLRNASSASASPLAYYTPDDANHQASTHIKRREEGTHLPPIPAEQLNQLFKSFRVRVRTALAHSAPPLDLGPFAPVEHEEQRDGELCPSGELEEERPELGVVPDAIRPRVGGVRVLVLEPLGRGDVLEPEGGVDADAQGARAVFVLLEAVDDCEVRDRSRLARFVDDLERSWLIGASARHA